MPYQLSGLESAGALNTGEPVKEPQTHRTGDVEDHLPDLDLEFAIRSCRCHLLSLPVVGNKMSDSRGRVS
jgi:hypothetical protein